MSKLNLKSKQQIVALRKKGHSNSAIRDIMNADGHQISRHSVRYWLTAYDRGDIDNDQDTTSCPTFRKVSVSDAELIGDCLKKDPSTSSRQVYSELKAAGAQFSLSTTKRAIEAVGFTASKPSYGQLVREVNKVKRVEFCQMLIDTNETFDDIIFSDESSIQLHQNKTVMYRLKGSLPAALPKPKHPLKVHVWAAISRRGPSKITIFDGIMEKEFFTKSILRDNLLPFIKERFPDSHRFQQDNDPKHRSNMAKQFMEENGINWWTVWPSESPDINPIEMVWNQMKRNIARSEPKTKNELLQCIQKFWIEEMTTEQCNMYIDHIYKVVPACILMKGAATAKVPNFLFRERSREKSIAYFNQKVTEDEEVRQRIKAVQIPLGN